MCSRKVLAHFFQNYWIPVTTYFIGNQQKKTKWMWSLGKIWAKLGQILGIWGDTFFSKKNCLFKHLSENLRQIYLEIPHLKDIRANFFAELESKMAKNWLFSSISLYLVSFNVTNGIII